MASDDQEFTAEEKAYLRHEEFVAEVLKRRSPSESKKSGLQAFLESSGGTAIVTLLLTGGFTTVITHILQKNMAERDFQNQIVKLYSEHRLSVQKGLLDGRVQTLRSSLELLGKVLNHGQSRVDIDGPRFARRMDPELQKKNEAQQEEIRKQFNATWELWDSQKGALEPLLGYYFGQDVKKAWHEVVSRTDDFVRCADLHKPNAQGQDLCQAKEKTAAEVAVANLIDRLAEAPNSDWITREDVEKVRSVLERRN
jgi:hypothetical protein